MRNSIEQYKGRLREKAAGPFGKPSSSGHKPESYLGAPTPLVVVPASGVLMLLKSKVTSCIQLSQ